jgi:tetratricopeptide (TPR) repeat protein
MFVEDPETDSLLREATQWADAKEWDRAIACLEKADARMQVSPVIYPILTWLRLPLYLQKAGRFDEAMAEFERLMQETPDRIARHFAHRPKAERGKFVRHEKSVIKDKMALAKEREKKRKAKAQG